MAGSDGLTWGVSSATVNIGETITVSVVYGMAPTASGITAAFNGLATAAVGTNEVEITGVSAGTVTVPAGTNVGNMVRTVNAFTLTVTGAAEDESYLNKRGLAHFWENIDDIKQDKLTAGTGISITNNVISATGGGVADSVAWGHITGTMADQTDLTTALGAKANSADLATVATSGDYDDLTDKPTIGNATLTIQKNGTSAGTFTANATSNKTINITVPTTAADVSALPASTKYGASISVSINTTDYKVTTTLKDQDGNTLGTAQVIDLPLESVVVNGSYDSTDEKIVLTLQNGNTIDIPVGDLVAGLQSEITSTNKLSSDLVDDTNHTHKFVTAAQITKLNGIAAGAEVNQNAFSNVKVGTTTVAADAKTDTLELVAGSNVTITPDATNDKVTIAATNTTYDDATTTTHGLMTAADKVKLNGIATGAEVNVQSDWNQTNTSADDYIKNKPTKVSDFTNDAGYITSYTDTQVTQTRVDPSEITTFYPVASTSSYTNTGDVKKFGAVKLKYASDDGGTAELELGQNSYNDPVSGALTLWNMGTSQYKTTLQRGLGASNQTFYLPYNADSTSGTLIANGAANTGTGSATNPVYADNKGILHATTYALNATVPSNAVFTDTTYSDATTSTAGLMSASDKTKLNGIAAGAEVNVQSDWGVTDTSSDAFIKNKPALAAVATSGSYNDLSNKPTIGNATLTIAHNGASAGTFTANATSNKTININAPKRINLSGSAQTSSWHRTVIGLCEVSTTNNTGKDSFSSGRIVMHRDNGLSGVVEINIQMENQYSNAYYTNVAWYSNLKLLPASADINTAKGFRPCTFKYNNVWYGGIEVFVDNAQLGHVVFEGDTNFSVFALDYYQVSHDSTAASILNQEVYGSLNYSQWALSKGKEFFNNIDLYTGSMTKNDTYTYTFPDKNGTVAMTSDIPSVPTVNNGQLTIQKNGSNVATFTANQSGNATANITVPTKTSDITNDSNFVASGDLATVATSGSYNDLTNKPTIPTVNNATLTIQKNGSTVKTFTANASSNVTANITVPTKTSDLTNDSNFVEDANYVHTDNNYTTTDKNKLAGIASGAEVNVQANWTQTTTTADDYIKNKPTLATVATSGSYNDLSNKPTIPTVNNATLTIQKNGSTVKTFTANASSNVTANITVPTALSDLSGTVSSSQIASGAVTDDKIDWTSFGSSEWPVINTDATNANVNSSQFYNQYEYTVPVDGVYAVMFSQRLTNGTNNYDFTIRITYDGTQVQAVAAGGSTWTNWIPGTVFAFIEAKAGKIIRCQSSGGGTGSHTTQNGRVSIMRIR